MQVVERIAKSNDPEALQDTITATDQLIEAERSRALASGEIKSRTGVNSEIRKYERFRSEAGRRLGRLRKSQTAGYDVAVQETRNRAVNRRNRIVRQREQTITSAQYTNVQAGTQPSSQWPDGVEVRRSPLSGRAVLIQDTPAQRNRAALEAFQQGYESPTASSEERFYASAIPVTARRSSGFQYQPQTNRQGEQAPDQPGASLNINFLQAQARRGGEDITTPDMSINARASRALFGDQYRRTAIAQTATPVLTRFGRVVAGRAADTGMGQDFIRGQASEVIRNPVTFAGLTAAGAATGGVGRLASRSVIGARVFNTGTLLASGAYLGAVSYGTAVSPNRAEFLGRESTRFLAFGSGFALGSGNVRVIGRAPVTRAQVPGVGLGRRPRVPRGERVIITDPFGRTATFSARTGRRIITPRERVTAFGARTGQGLQTLVGSRRGGQRLLPPRQITRPRPRLRNPSRSRSRVDDRVIGLPRIGRSTRIGGIARTRFGSRSGSINRFRTFSLPQSSSGLSVTPFTGIGSRARTGLGIGSIITGTALGVGLLTGRGRGRTTGGFGLGAGGGRFGRGVGGFGSGFNRAQYTPSFVALDLGITAPRARRRTFTGLEIRPVVR